MPTHTPTKSKRESIYDKAERLVVEGRYEMVDTSRPPHFWVGWVRGDHGTYRAFAISEQMMADHAIAGGRVGCSCLAGATRKLCSHAVLAEEMRLRGGKS